MTRAEALLRTVVGISDARIIAHPAGGVAVVRVQSNDHASRGQIVRNVRSALYAGFGIAVSNECVDFVDGIERDNGDRPTGPVIVADTTPSAKPTSSPVAPAPIAARTPAPSAHSGKQIASPRPLPAVPAAYFDSTQPAVASLTQTLRAPRIMQVVAEVEAEEQAAAAHAATEAAPAAHPAGHVVRDIVASAAALKLESVEMRRQAGRLRCRVVISLGADHFGAVADSSDPNAGEIHLAGRVACDALRAGGFTDARFDGAAVAHINGRQHVVVALSEWMSGETVVLSGAAPLEDLPERAAAIAAIKAVLAQDIN